MYSVESYPVIPDSELIIERGTIYHTKSQNGSSESYIEIIDENQVIKKYKLLDEDFNILIDGDNIILTHPNWSLSGMGDTLLEAERNLYKEAGEIFDYYNSIPDTELTIEAVQLKEFLKRIH